MPIQKSKAAAAPEVQLEMFTEEEMGPKQIAKTQSKRTITPAMSGPDLVKFIYSASSSATNPEKYNG